MGIQVEFNPDLALRKFGTKGRLEDECLPENLQKNRSYNFKKEGQRNYWLQGEIHLLETEGNGNLSRPLASITIIEYTHKLDLMIMKPCTMGKYFVNEVYDINNPKIHFEGINKIKENH